MGFIYLVFFNQASVRLGVNYVAEVFSNGIIRPVAQNSRHGKQSHYPPHIQRAYGGKRPHSKKQGIPGKKRRENKARLGKYYREKYPVGPGAEALKNRQQVFVRMHNKFNKKAYHLNSFALLCVTGC